MNQLFDPVVTEPSQPILCGYMNCTNQIQIARISNIPNWYFERVVFPGQRLFFETPINAQLEIHTGAMASAILADVIPCRTIQIQEADTPDSAA